MSRNASVGHVAQVTDRHQPFAMGQDVCLLRRRNSAYSPDYLQFLLQSPSMEHQFSNLMAGSTFKRLNVQDIKELRITFPAPQVQASIGEALGNTEDQIDALKRLISKKQAIKQGMLQQLLTGRTRLAGFTSAWKVRKVGDFTTVTAGGTPPTSVPRYWGGAVHWMSSGELHKKRVYDVTGRITEVGLQESSAQLLPAGSVLIGLAGQGKTRGTVAISGIKLSTNQSIAGILPSREHSSDFLYYNLDTRYDELRAMSTGVGGRGGLNLTIIRSIPVLLPEVREQRAIAEVLTDVDDELGTLSARLQKAMAVKQGMMQELLTGRTRLPPAEVVG
jgi:type I restriction enzyme, S subunit